MAGYATALRMIGSCALLCACQLPPSEDNAATVDGPIMSDKIDGASPVDLAAPPDLIPGPPGALHIIASNDEDGTPLPVRVIIDAAKGTAQPIFDKDYLAPNGTWYVGGIGRGITPGVLGAPEGVMLWTGEGQFPIPPGTYDVFVTHGPEWEAHEERVTVTSHGVVQIDAPLRHSVDTTGWLAADMHIHTMRSFDSWLPLDDRVLSEVAVGVELLVATDHNVITDLGPNVIELGYQGFAHAVMGDEFNFGSGIGNPVPGGGHGGVYPLVVDAKTYRDDPDTGGATKMKLDYPTVFSVDAGAMFDDLHALPNHPAVTVNHPRLGGLGMWVTTPTPWSPGKLPPNVGQFDAIELLNGYQDSAVNGPHGNGGDIPTLMRDWFFLLSSGFRVTALGNSDTHRLADVRAGFPRSWLRVPSDDVTQFTDDQLAPAIQGGRAIASNGPFATLKVDGVAIGDLDTNTSGNATVEITVDAPGWIDVTHAALWVNGDKAKDFDCKGGLRPILHETFTLKLPPGDAWIALTASGKKPLPSALIGEHQDGMVVPFVVTNPVFIDGDGDGQWHPMIANPDPGMGQMPDSSFDFGSYGDGDGHGGHVDEDCEPPLWMIPSTWDTPR